MMTVSVFCFCSQIEAEDSRRPMPVGRPFAALSETAPYSTTLGDNGIIVSPDLAPDGTFKRHH